ncbi:MAG TPA: OmpA family protein [Coriobacteriia bacterium]
MSSHRWRIAPLAAPILLMAACSHPQHPAALTPQNAPDLAAAARRDSIALAQRNDSLRRLTAERTHADSVRAEVENGGGVDAANAAVMLPAAEDSVLVARLHFAFNDASLTPEDQSTLDRKVSLLNRYQRLRVEIAGNADERGSDEYNLALGLRRAAAAKAYLVNYGVTGERIAVISYGKERPLDPAHTEGAWAANRRDEFLAKSNNP